MTPRNPENSSDLDVQSKSLQGIQDTLDGHTRAAAVSEPHSAPLPTPRRDESAESKLTLDRVEAYLKGPTAFSA